MKKTTASAAQKKKIASVQTLPEDKNLQLAFSIGAVSLILLHFLFTFVFPGRLKPDFVFSRTWGFHFPIYYSLGWRIAFYSLALAATVPPVGRFVMGIGRRVFDLIAGIGRKQVIFVAVSLLSIPVFIVFRCKYGLLGDNFVRAADIARNNFIWHDSGTIFLLHYIFVALHALCGFNGAQALSSANILSGAVYVYLSLLIADFLGKSPFQKSAIALGMFSSVLVQLFFGYLEITPPAYVLITAHLYAALRYAAGKGSALKAAILLACGAGLCLVGLFFLPPFLYLIWSVERKRRPLLNKAWFIVALFGVALCIGWYPLTRWIIPDCLTLSPDADHTMPLFSAVHFWEFLNESLFALGVGAFLLPALIVHAITSRAKLDLQARFMILVFCSVAGGLFVFNEMLGAADADIFSVFAVIGGPAAAYLLIRLFDREHTAAAARHGAFAFLALMLLHTGFYIGINASDKSIARIKEIVLPDPGSFYIHHPAPMVLGIIFKHNGLESESNLMFKKSYEEDGDDSRNTCNYLSVLIRQNELDKALPIAMDLADSHPLYYPGLWNLYLIADQLHNAPLMFQALQKLYNSYRCDSALAIMSCGTGTVSDNLSAYVQDLIQLRQFAEADSVCSKLAAVCPVRDFSDYLTAYVKLQLGDYDSCLALCKPIIERKQANHLVYLTAAQAYEKKRQYAAAGTILETGIRSLTSPAGRSKLQAELDRLNRG